MRIVFSNEVLNTLKKSDVVIECLIDRYDISYLDTNDDIFYSIVINIIGQMLSLKVSKVLIGRLENISPIKPNNLLKLSIEDFVKIGISSKKAKYILELSNSIANKKIDLNTIKNLNDADARNYLLSIKGIGEWTADMILLFSLGRINIWSYKDVALKNGILRAYPNFHTLSERRFISLGKKFSPYRSIAALCFYKLNDDEDFYDYKRYRK